MSRHSLAWYCAAMFVVMLGVTCLRPLELTVPAQAAVATPETWEYQTASIDLGSLTTKLNDLGKDGWQVISILSTDSIVDTGPDGKAHVVAQRVEVTAKRQK